MLHDIRRVFPGRPIPVRAVFAALLAACFAAPAAPALHAQSLPPATPVAFVDVTVIPMDSERRLEHQTVIVRDGRIAAVGPVATTPVPAGTATVDGRGKYLMPGLAEMHGHVPAQPGRFAEDVMFLYVAAGVTTVRGMQGSPYHIELRDAVARGEILGPTFIPAGPQLSGNLRTPEQAANTVRQQKQAGFDLLKIQEGVSRPVYDTIVAVARELEMPFGGHVPDDVGLWGALAARQTTIDHLDNYLEAIEAADFPAAELPPARAGQTERQRRIAGVAAATKRAGVAVVPTMKLWETLYVPRDSAHYATWPELAYMPATVPGWFTRIRQGGRIPPDGRDAWIATRLEILAALHAAGVPILLGTDAPQLFSVPGFSVHRETAVMAQAGMTPYEIIYSGTRAVADHLGTPNEFGMVRAGHRADLILVDADPLADVANMKRRSGVVVRGRWLPERQIQLRLGQLSRGETP